MSNQAAIRPYEMSVWTLRDTFLASLRVPGIENKGQIEEPKMRLNTDGTQELSFKIPMYMYDWVTLTKEVESENEEEPKLISTPAFKKIENPRWYDVKHGLLMVGLRKIKVIFNKGTADEDVYEFLVTDITEEHADDNSLYCNVNCSGLAFQELGKKGYNISLSADTYYLDYDEVIEQQKEAKTEKDKPKLPINNINYWCDKVFKNSDWEYSIQMDWATYDGFILHRFFKDDIQLPDGTVTVNPNTPYIGYIGKDPENSVTVYISSAYTGTAKLNDAIVVDVTKVDDTTGKFPNATDPFVQERFITYTELLESERDALNYAREKYGLRRNDKIYEDDYTASWDISDDNILTPTHYEKFKEKRRMVESNESNIYNATQAIAEAFGVYCQYKYHYDNNYHIIKKEVIFYNDFMDELHGIIDLSYNYDVSSITRTLDSNDICTKLIVRSVDDDTSPSGKLSIMNTPANKTGENYLLNFDYLYQTGSIEKDQYEAIPKFELEVKKINKKLITLEESIMHYEREINEYEATIAIEKPSIVAAEEQVEKAYAGLLAITKNETGIIEVMPKMGVLLKGENGYYINISTQGVLEDTIQVYKECYGNEVQTETLIEREETTEGKTQINYQIIKDNNGNIIRLDGFKLDELQAAKYNCYYLKYSYRPELYYENIINTFSQRSLQSQQALEEAQEKLEAAQAAYDKVVEEHDNTLEQKQELIADFEKMMGPALREGTWQPDTYDDYGDYRASDFRFTNTIIEGKAKDDYIELKWDNEPFDEEQLGYYNLGVNTDPIYYPCIKLDSNLLSSIKDYLNNEDLNYTLQFKYDEVLLGGAVQESENLWTQTWNNKPYSAPTLDKLENKILLDKLIAEGYVVKGTDTLNTNTISDHILLAARQACGLSIHSPRFLTLGSEMTVGFLQDKTASKVVTPVLVLLGAEDHDINFENNAMLCISSIQTLNNKDDDIKVIEEDATTEETRIITDYSAMQLKRIINPIYSFKDDKDEHIIKNYSTDYTYVYPRLYVKDMSLKTSEDQLKLSIVNNDDGTTIKNLQNYYDYNLLARDDGYYITIEGQRLIENGNFDTTIHVDYVMSNAELNIYLDALEVMQSSAFPQVSYSVTVSMLNEKFMHKAYRHLNRIAHINDFELKFENVLGYIAELNLDLDHPWEDTIDVKNYKTKFEDLFTKIVASTEQMKANATVYNKAAAAFNFAGGIKSGTLNDALSATSLSLAFTKGNLTIDDKEGIRAESQDGIVMMNGGGIFCATEKNNSGDWIWNSGILPTGINASLLKAGTIDTNLIRIYAGDNLRFQMNANGLYAYRAKDADEADQEQYVVHNSDGLFLIAEAGTKPVISKILTKSVQLKSDNTKQVNWPEYDNQNNFKTEQVEYNTPLNTDVQRVEVSWDGLKLRNWKGQETFYADPDTGDLIIGGTLLQNASFITVSANTLQSIKDNYIKDVNTTTNTNITDRNLLRNTTLRSEDTEEPIKSFEDYFIEELVEDETRTEVDKHIRFLTPNVAALKIDDFIKYQSTAIADKMVQDAIETKGRITERLNDVSSTLQQSINSDYMPIIASISSIVNNKAIKEVKEFPSEADKYDGVKLTEKFETYEPGTYWYDGTGWVPLITKNINLGTSQELNLFGAKATFIADSELKMLTGGKLHLFGGKVYISSTAIANNQTEQQKLEETPLNGIVLDNNGLAIYSTKNITIGTQKTINDVPHTLGLELNGSNGSLTAITSGAAKGAIKFCRLEKDSNNNDTLTTAVVIDGYGIDISNANFQVHRNPVDDQSIFFVGASNGEYIKYKDNELIIKGKISADALILNSDGSSGQTFGGALSNLQNQIDGEIDTWFYKGEPSNSGLPESDWTSVVEKHRHVGDLYYDIGSPILTDEDYSPTAGQAWRYIENNEQYSWSLIGDTAVTTALAAAAEAKSAADDAKSMANKIYNGTKGLAWTDSEDNETTINKSGISIYGGNGGYFKVDSSKLGFYNNTDEALLYYDNGDVFLKGNIFTGGHFYTINNGNVSIEEDTIEQYLENKAENKAGAVLTAALGENGNITTTINNTINSTINSLRSGYNGTLNELDTSISSISSSLPKKLADATANALPVIFNAQPTSYKVGDIWYKQVDNYKHKYVCITTNNTYNANDWVATDGGQIQSPGLKIDAEANTVSIYAGGSINILTESNSASNNVTLNKDGITMFTNSMFSAIGNAVIIATNGSKTQPVDNYIWMRTPTGENPRLDIKTAGNMEIASGGNMTIAAGGKMTIGASSGQEATLSLLSTGKLTAYGSEVILASSTTFNTANPTGGYLWMNKNKIDMGVSGNFQILSGGSFKAIAANEVLIAASNNTTAGSYLWMHDVDSRKKLDIGTTGDFTIGSGGNFTVDSGNINMTTSNFALNVVDKENPDVALMSMVATGSEGFETFYAKEIVSDSIIPVYTGPTIITISNSILDEHGKQIEGYYNTLSSALSNLNNTYIMQDITINYAYEQDHIEEQEIIIEGILGTGKITINGAYEKTTTDENDNEIKNIIPTMIHNDIRITACTAQIELQHFDVQPLSIVAENTRHNLIEIERNSSVIINNCNLFGGKTIPDNTNTSTNNDIVLDKNLVGEVLIYIKTSQVEINSTTFQSADYGIVQISGSTQMFNCTGNVVYSVHIEKSMLFCDQLPGGTRQCILSGQIFAQSSTTGTATAASDTATASTEVTTTETITKSFKAAKIRSARGGGWDDKSAQTNNVIDVMQGCYDANNKISSSKRWWYGCMWFNLDEILEELKKGNKELDITACSLKLSRRSSGGTKAERPLYIIYDSDFILESANAKSYTNLERDCHPIQTITAGLIWGKTGSFNIDTSTANFKQMFNNLINSTINDKRLCLILYEAPGNNQRTSEYSTGYSRYYGKVSGYEPTLTLTYQIVDKQS